ncbi:MAG TPA: ATP-binding protein [Candidatus Hydrogenedentes bacterium]|nr:ATP-binding protein [Candidatus Hydrogenedentota bacterium]
MPTEMPTEFIDHVWLGTGADEADMSREFVFEGGKPYLTGLAKANIFIGPNNSGKSRFLRALSGQDLNSFRNVTGVHADSLTLIEGQVQRYNASIVEALNRRGFQHLAESLILPSAPANRKDKRDVIHWINDLLARLLDPNVFSQVRERVPGTLAQRQQSTRNEILAATKHEIVSNAFDRIYVPVLRGLRHPKKGAVTQFENKAELDVYEQRTLQDYFEGQKSGRPRNIFTGLLLYLEVRRRLLGRQEERELIRKYEDFLRDAFFGGRQVSITPDESNDVVLVQIGDEERPIYELGDGVQQMIIMTFPVFFQREKPVLLFVEEPELYLHPGMQRQFLELFTSQNEVFGNCQVFMATHSNHFLDMTLDMDNVSVYRFTKEMPPGGGTQPRFHIENTSNTDHNLLRELGVHNSSVFLTNCTIWVEGVTDRMYLRKYLQLYQQSAKPADSPEFREDVHYTIAEYGGANVAHWFFGEASENKETDNNSQALEHEPIRAERLCGRAFVIADRDIGKEERHAGRQEEMKKRYYVLPYREIENLLSPELLMDTIKSYKACKDFEGKLPEHKDYADIPLGGFIDKDLNPGRVFGDGSGAIKDKPAFAQKALAHMRDWKQLSEEAQELATRVYEFIKEHNPS